MVRRLFAVQVSGDSSNVMMSDLLLVCQLYVSCFLLSREWIGGAVAAGTAAAGAVARGGV